MIPVDPFSPLGFGKTAPVGKRGLTQAGSNFLPALSVEGGTSLRSGVRRHGAGARIARKGRHDARSFVGEQAVADAQSAGTPRHLQFGACPIRNAEMQT